MFSGNISVQREFAIILVHPFGEFEYYKVLGKCLICSKLVIVVVSDTEILLLEIYSTKYLRMYKIMYIQ